jgi:probable rRNA maturation factor
LIVLSLIPGIGSRLKKISGDMKTYERLLPRVTRAFAEIRWQIRKGNSSDKSRQVVLVHLISDAVMKKLNTKYRAKATATDVLSFSYLEAEAPLFAHEPVGEIYISHDTAVRQAKKLGTALADELAVLTVHGALHVMGYDHERSAAEHKKMQQAEKRILTRAGLPVTGLIQR